MSQRAHLDMAGYATRSSLKRAASAVAPAASLPRKAQRAKHEAKVVRSPYFPEADSEASTAAESTSSRPQRRGAGREHAISSSSSAAPALKVEGETRVVETIVIENDSADTAAAEDSATLQTPAKSKKPKQGTKLSPRLAPRPAPAGWLDTYSIIQELRMPRDAPVDSMGAEALPQGPDEVDRKTARYQVLVALMLSSQTKDQTVSETIKKLQSHGLTVDNILATPPAKLNVLIGKVGFHNIKTKDILETTRILKEKHDSDVPDTVEELIALPGIGPKMAFIILSIAHDIHVGIGIDTHMHRIMNILGWVSSKDPEGTRVQLESWLPREHWPHVNLMFVGFGQQLQQERAKLLRRCCLDCSRPADALRLVFRLGAPPTLQCKATKQTVLHWVAQRGDPEAVSYVVQKTGKQLFAVRDVEGRIPADLAASEQIRKMLLD